MEINGSRQRKAGSIDRFGYDCCIAHQKCIGDFSDNKSRANESFRCCKNTQTWIVYPFHSESEYMIVTSSFDYRKCESIIFFRMQRFVWSVLTANYTMLESYFEILCTSLSLVKPAGKIPPFVNYTQVCSGIMSLNHGEYKIMNVIGLGTIPINVLVVLCWNFIWQVFTAGQMFTRLT